METEKIEFKKLNLLNLLKAATFIIIFLMLLIAGDRIFMPKKIIVQGTSALGFYGEPKNSIDILAIGNSNVYCGISPLVLWKEHGFVSYVSGEGNQDISQAYHRLEEALTCQNPKLVILETDEIFQKNHNVIESSIAYNVQRVIPIMGYHNRWKTLAADDFTKTPVMFPYQSNSKGFSINVTAQAYTGKEYMVPSNSRLPIESSTLYYLDKFVALCAERHIQLIFVNVPCAVEWNYSKHNAIADYAKVHNILYLDLNLNRNSFGFNWKTDTKDKGDHLNCSGAQKTTSYLGNYISKNFKIPNHSKDAEFQSWNKDLAAYEKKVAAK